MRKPTIFNPAEKEFLISTTQLNLQAAINFPEKSARIETVAAEVLAMLSSDWDHYYPVECVNYIERVIKDFLKPFSEKIKHLLDTPLSQILEQQEVESLDLKLIDKCNSILGKLGRRKTKFNFMDVFERIQGSQQKQNRQEPSTSFEWEPVAKSETMLFEMIPGESGVDHLPISKSENKTSSIANNLFIDLITEERGYREVA